MRIRVPYHVYNALNAVPYQSDRWYFMLAACSGVFVEELRKTAITLISDQRDDNTIKKVDNEIVPLD